MPIQSGTHVGPYEIVSAIGAGGMGEVYRARDPKLGRDVAIKVLPDAFANDAQRMARFQREAKVLASLSHPNIATIYGLEDSSSTHALVMELVEGPTLADRIRQSIIPIDEAVRIARQIADALEYAHERGIVHRDLKPANIKITADDTVKVLDFGLAKALAGDTTSVDISTSPTISRMATQQGVLLGTAAYMSPEQAKGKSVDRRADIWAFGCVLYEMLTGKIAFPGDSVTDTLAGVIRAEPDWSLLPSSTPMRVRVLLQRCLQKDPKQRLRDIGDARISLDEVLSGAPDPAVASTPAVSAHLWGRALPWAALAACLAVALAALAFVHFREKPAAPANTLRLQIAVPEKVAIAGSGTFALSPDGRQLAFTAIGSDGVQQLWVRPLSSLEARPLPGAESPSAPPFFWSPDSRYIAFDGGGRLRKIPVSGGPAETICHLSDGLAVGGSWNRDGVIIFGTSRGGVMRVSAGGGPATPLTKLEPSRSEDRHVLPWFLPDGRHFIYKRDSTQPGNSGVYLGSLDAKPEDQPSKPLLTNQYGAAYVPSDDPGSGYLLFVREGTLLAQPFDAHRLELAGDAVTLTDGLGAFLDFGYFSPSSNGEIVYRATGVGGYRLAWYDQQGKPLGTAGEANPLLLSVQLSPNGTRAAVSRLDSQRGIVAVWLLDFSRGTDERFTLGSTSAFYPVWSPDGNHIIFALLREDGHIDLYQKPASGATEEQLLLKSDEPKYPSSWSRDGRFLLYSASDAKGKSALWVLPLEGDKKPFLFLHTEFNESDGQFSPDGHWVAYVSDESGRNEIYVRPFSPESGGTASAAGGKWLISKAGGTDPRWRGDGKELYYIALDGKLMAVELATSSVLQAAVPKVLFQTQVISNTSFRWDVTTDGKRFLVMGPATEFSQAPFTVVLNWPSLLKK